ncbi:MAG: hypothetical protein ACRCWR_09940 [Saezia sp.]
MFKMIDRVEKITSIFTHLKNLLVVICIIVLLVFLWRAWAWFDTKSSVIPQTTQAIADKAGDVRDAVAGKVDGARDALVDANLPSVNLPSREDISTKAGEVKEAGAAYLQRLPSFGRGGDNAGQQEASSGGTPKIAENVASEVNVAAPNVSTDAGVAGAGSATEVNTVEANATKMESTEPQRRTISITLPDLGAIRETYSETKESVSQIGEALLPSLRRNPDNAEQQAQAAQASTIEAEDKKVDGAAVTEEVQAVQPSSSSYRSSSRIRNRWRDDDD